MGITLYWTFIEEAMAERIVHCARLQQDLPGLATPPFPGDLGQRIFEGVSRQAWDAWQKRSAELMRERALSMADPQARKLLLQEMQVFLFSPEPQPDPKAPLPPGMVRCAKLGKLLPGLKKAPFPGALGERILESVSQEAWKLWEGQAVIVMNHYGLSMADPEARKFLMQQCEEFFFGEGAKLPEDWVPPAPGGKGGGGKGAPAPRQK
jgi:Fe-S cluster biosynthesis and repair protein YggX